jgi:hypothetical protein
MDKAIFDQDETYLPLTMKQFEDLTNEVLTKLNGILAPNALDADYTAQILMSAIHALDHKHGIVTKTDLFNSCVNRISCHVTYHAVQEIQERLKKANAKDKDSPRLSVIAPTEQPDASEGAGLTQGH